MQNLSEMMQRYVNLLLSVGINLQPAQSLHISAELAHAEMVRILIETAYQQGATYVDVQWVDIPSVRARLLHCADEHLDYVPDFDVTRYRQMTDESWARLALVGPEFPDGLADVNPEKMRRTAIARRSKMRFYADAMSANKIQWCVAAVPTPAWAAQVYPEMTSDEGMTHFWQTLFEICRIDQPDPVAAWQAHDVQLSKVSEFMAHQHIRSVRFLDERTGPDGKPNTDLTVGLTDRPVWVAASSQRPDGVGFIANIPTEEVFTTPHRLSTYGYVRTSKPAFPFERRVEDALFRFDSGQLIEWSAAVGQDVLDEFFAIDGAKYLGEVSMVDERSPINQAGILFYETLLDENAVCHIAFGDAYPGGIEGGDDMDRESLDAMGANYADVHVDFMIGTSTMSVTGFTASGDEIAVMNNGRFVADITNSS